MEFKYKLKKHRFTQQTDWDILMEKINEVSERVMNSRYGLGNFIVTSPAVAEALSNWSDLIEEHRPPNYDFTSLYPDIHVGDFRIEGDTYIQDVTITPRTQIGNITVNITTDSWDDIID